MAYEHETIVFGKYFLDDSGQKLDLVWRVLEKEQDKTYLITEKVIAYKQFSVNNKNDWENSDLRKWLNGQFYETAFSAEEKSRIVGGYLDDKVGLLSETGYYKCFRNQKDAKAEYTTKYLKECPGANYYDHAFYWLRTANKSKDSWTKNDDTLYVLHVCHTGKINCFMRAEGKDGVRPVIWIKND